MEGQINLFIWAFLLLTGWMRYLIFARCLPGRDAELKQKTAQRRAAS